MSSEAALAEESQDSEAALAEESEDERNKERARSSTWFPTVRPEPKWQLKDRLVKRYFRGPDTEPRAASRSPKQVRVTIKKKIEPTSATQDP